MSTFDSVIGQIRGEPNSDDQIIIMEIQVSVY